MPTLSKLLHPSLVIYTILALALTGHLLIGPVVAVPIAGGGGVGVSDGPMPGGMNLELRTVPFVRFGEAANPANPLPHGNGKRTPLHQNTTLTSHPYSHHLHKLLSHPALPLSKRRVLYGELEKMREAMSNDEGGGGKGWTRIPWGSGGHSEVGVVQKWVGGGREGGHGGVGGEGGIYELVENAFKKFFGGGEDRDGGRNNNAAAASSSSTGNNAAPTSTRGGASSPTSTQGGGSGGSNHGGSSGGNGTAAVDYGEQWPAGVKMVVNPKGGNSAGYSQNSLNVLKSQQGGNPDAVTPAGSSGTAQSVGMGIESVDIGYLADVNFGTPSKAYSLLVDTGSADTWIGAESCTECSSLQTIGPSSSSSFKTTNNIRRIQYGQGFADMQESRDTVSVAGFTLDEFTFGNALTIDPQFARPGAPLDGILGTAFSKLNVLQAKTIPENLVAAGTLNNAIVGYALGRVAEEVNTGQLTIGGYDAGKMNFDTKQEVPVSSTKGFWQLQTGAIMVGNTLVAQNKEAILDTGTTLMFVPPADADAIHQQIAGAQPTEEGGYSVPCTMSEVMRIQFGNVLFAIDPRDITLYPVNLNDPTGDCISSIAPQTIDGPDTWLVGDPFLKNVYMITDVNNQQIWLSAREGVEATTVA